MIIFKRIRWKNLLSTGNIFTEVNLNETSNALIIGENGAGKSTILDALTFVLFGKPFRKINKPQLLNSINGKECIVEIEFETNNKKYKVVRGIKPNVFEIYCDNICLNQDSASKDYQEHLEKFILKMGYKSFCQIVILGSASFVPFMQLSPADRRTIIEDLLDIQVFSVMNNIVKKKLSENRESLEKNKLEISGKKDKEQYVSSMIVKLKQNNKEKRDELSGKYVENKKVFEALQAEITELTDKSNELQQQISTLSDLKKRHNKLLILKSKIETNKCRHEKELSFYSTNESCPTCRQTIDEAFRAEEVNKTTAKLSEFESGIENITKEIDSCISDIDNKEKIVREINQIQQQISNKSVMSHSIIEQQALLVKEIDKLDDSNNLLSTNKQELKNVKNALEKLEKERLDLLSQKQYIDTGIMLLKDGGIKTKIIKQYLPVINKHINKYLIQMGFFASFNIDENFEEHIKSRYCDDFSYQNFSEGEKTRIDLAILFTWRQIAKMRNSVNCNLLIFDEIFDGSLDTNGTDEFLKIMWNMLEDTNTFVISHKDTILDKFERVYKFKKKGNFSIVV